MFDCLVAGRRYAELEDGRHGTKLLGQRLHVLTVGGPDHHAIVELGAVPILAIAHLGDGEAMLGEEPSHVSFRHHLPLGEAKQMVGKKMSWNAGLDPAKCSERAERRKRTEYRGIKESHAIENAERGRDPDKTQPLSPADREALLKDDAGAEETDASHDALRHTSRVAG